MKKRQKAELLFHRKLNARGRIREMKVWKIIDQERYPDNLRYRMVFVTAENGFVHLLYDNHWPKGHHVHVAGKEESYTFETFEILVRRFREQCDEIERLL